MITNGKDAVYPATAVVLPPMEDFYSGGAALSGLSLMPEGLETAVSIEQMADLIAFLLLSP
jgi:hypothetical protein